MARVFGTWKSNLAQFQVIANEATNYTAATAAWRGVFGGWDDNRTREMTEENIGLELSSERTYDAQYAVTIPVAETEFTFEQSLYMFTTGIINPTPTGTGPYTWPFGVPVDGSARSTNFLAWEIGNVKVPTDAHLIPLSFFSEIKLAGRRGQSWKMSGTVEGNRAIINGGSYAAGTFDGFTSPLALPTVNPAMFSDASFYIDDSGGTIGSTQVTDTLLAADITIDTGIQWLPPGDGNRYPTIVKRGAPSLTFSLTYELEEDTSVSTVATERAQFNDPAHVRLIRISTPGPTTQSLTIDIAAKYDSIGQYSQEDDLDTAVTFEGHATLSATDSLFFDIELVNGVASV